MNHFHKPMRCPISPVPPKDAHKLGDAVSDARDAAMAARVAAWNKYVPAQETYASDVVRYEAGLSAWNSQKDTMQEPDKTNCFNALTSAYTALGSESNKINNAYGHAAAGDTAVTNGDNAQNQQQKIMYYNNAKDHFNVCGTASDEAATPHGTFAGFMTTAESYLT